MEMRRVGVDDVRDIGVGGVSLSPTRTKADGVLQLIFPLKAGKNGISNTASDFVLKVEFAPKNLHIWVTVI